MRYVLDPVAAEISGGEIRVRSLRKLQNVLGELHDRDVIIDFLESEGDKGGDAKSLRRMAERERGTFVRQLLKQLEKKSAFKSIISK